MWHGVLGKEVSREVGVISVEGAYREYCRWGVPGGRGLLGGVPGGGVWLGSVPGGGVLLGGVPGGEGLVPRGRGLFGGVPGGGGLFGGVPGGGGLLGGGSSVRTGFTHLISLVPHQPPKATRREGSMLPIISKIPPLLR